MESKPNTHRKDIEERANVIIETDPEGDARRSQEQAPEDPSGVKIIGGGQHGKPASRRGVKRVSRRRPT